jgi:GntR family transcriptional regulator
MSGDLAPGTRLPSTPRLVEKFGVSSTAVDKALAVLKREGYLRSPRGTGVYVRDRQRFRVEAGTNLSAELDGYSYEMLEVGEVLSPAEVAAALGLEPGDHILLRRGLLRRHGRPVQMDWSYYPLDLVTSVELVGPRGSAPRALAEMGYPQCYFVDAVSARMPTTEEVDLLELPNVPVIRQFRVVYSDGDRPVEASILVKGSHLYELAYRLPAGGPGSSTPTSTPAGGRAPGGVRVGGTGIAAEPQGVGRSARRARDGAQVGMAGRVVRRGRVGGQQVHQGAVGLDGTARHRTVSVNGSRARAPAPGPALR